MQLRQVTKVFRAFADSTRLRILNLLLEEPGMHVNRMADALQLPQSTVSRQLALLRSAAVVEDEREGRWVRYYMAEGPLLGEGELPSTVLLARAQSPELRADLKRLKSLK